MSVSTAAIASNLQINKQNEKNQTHSVTNSSSQTLAFCRPFEKSRQIV